jgi:hypothetical protein
MDYILFKGLLHSVDLWCDLSSSPSVDLENIFLNSIDNLNKFRGLEVLRGKLLESSASEAERLARGALLLLEESLSKLEKNCYEGDLEIKIAYSVLHSDISGAISETNQFLENIRSKNSDEQH